MFAKVFSPVVQWIECQIPVLMMGVRVPSGEQKKPFKGFFSLQFNIRSMENSYTLNLKCMISPSSTIYVLPSTFNLPASLQAFSEP